MKRFFAQLISDLETAGRVRVHRVLWHIYLGLILLGIVLFGRGGVLGLLTGKEGAHV